MPAIGYVKWIYAHCSFCLNSKNFVVCDWLSVVWIIIIISFIVINFMKYESTTIYICVFTLGEN